MKTYLVTGAAGFIGSNFIKYLLYKNEEDIKIIVLDSLTYAGNLGTIKDDIDNKRCYFVRGDIRDRELADKLFTENDIDYVVNFCSRKPCRPFHRRPSTVLSVNILGTQNLLDAARHAWVTGKDEQGYPTWKAGQTFPSGSHRRSLWQSGAEGFFTEKDPTLSSQPLQCFEDQCRPLRDGLS